MVENDDINEEDIKAVVKSFKSIPPKYTTAAIVICLFYLFFQLGYMYGYTEAYDGQKEYYEVKMLKYCQCRDSVIYDLDNLPDLNKELVDSISDIK